LWVAAYVACLILVLSFIGFEVLDIDGSDFVNPLRVAATIKVADPEQDLRRVALHPLNPSLPVIVALSRRAEQLQIKALVEGVRAATSVPTPGRHEVRSLLPRSLLADPAPSA
jgi:hypothetical protein